MAGHDIIVIGASLGGVEALQKLVGALPADLPAAVFVVLHTPASGPSLLPELLARSGKLPVERAVDLAPIQAGHVFVSVPDRHLVLERDRMRVTQGARENRHRPAIDVLFRSAALSQGARVVGVILTGLLDDGVAGLMAIKAWGGVTIVQDPAEAYAPEMPRSALARVPVDYVCSLQEIPARLGALAQLPAEPLKPPGEVATAATPEAAREEPSVYGCPTCGGVLWEIDEGLGWFRFRCRVGHAYSPRSLLAEQQQALEESLWSARRALEEIASLGQRLADAEPNGYGEPEPLRAQAQAALERARRVRQLLGDG